MTNKDLNNWIMYHEIQRLSRLGFKAARIGRYLGVDRRTVEKRLAMDQREYEQFLLSRQDRLKKLAPYEDFVKSKLVTFEDTSAAQIFDWLKEHYANLPKVSARTVYNFVMYIRQKHNIPVVPSQRDYFPVEELPFGYQAQVDFGEYNMRLTSGRQKKVWFFAMVLSASRYKFIIFSDKAFTTTTVCQAHEQAFGYFGGIPEVVVYDQDRTMMIDENLGQLLLTSGFSSYVKARGYKLHFCRKADPESKGKVESVIQYVKKNFLYNRTYTDLETLNDEALAWLGRTANYLEHHVTKISPAEAFYTEQSYLNIYKPLSMEHKNEKEMSYLVRKDRTVNYRGNFYSVPTEIYQGPDTFIFLKEQDSHLFVYNLAWEHICMHKIPEGTGNKVINNNHKRDHSLSIEQLIQDTSEYFTDKMDALMYLNQIREAYPRYVRDQVQAVLRAVRSGNTEVADRSLTFCLKNKVFNAVDFEQVYNIFFLEQDAPEPANQPIKLMDEKSLEKASETPEKSNLDDYENIFNS